MKQIHRLHNANFGLIGRGSFSAQLSALVNVEKIIKWDTIETKSGKNNFYGLSDWFNEEGKLKNEYVERLKAPENMGA